MYDMCLSSTTFKNHTYTLLLSSHIKRKILPWCVVVFFGDGIRFFLFSPLCFHRLLLVPRLLDFSVRRVLRGCRRRRMPQAKKVDIMPIEANTAELSASAVK